LLLTKSIAATHPKATPKTKRDAATQAKSDAATRKLWRQNAKKHIDGSKSSKRNTNSGCQKPKKPCKKRSAFAAPQRQVHPRP